MISIQALKQSGKNYKSMHYKSTNERISLVLAKIYIRGLLDDRQVIGRQFY